MNLMRSRRSASASVLYDAPGPRTRPVSLLAVVLIVLAAYFLVYRPLDANGQFTEAKWGPLLSPDNKNFDRVWRRLSGGLVATLEAAALAIVASMIFGTLLATL